MIVISLFLSRLWINVVTQLVKRHVRMRRIIRITHVTRIRMEADADNTKSEISAVQLAI